MALVFQYAAHRVDGCLIRKGRKALTLKLTSLDVIAPLHLIMIFHLAVPLFKAFYVVASEDER